MELETALDARSGTVCVVGAGGKKTTLYTLANHLGRAVVTATVRIPIFDSEVREVVVTDDPAAALREAAAGTDADANANAEAGAPGDAGDGWPLGLVPGRDKSNRYRGYDRETVDALGDAAAAADVPVLVKADGARTRDFKAPNDEEPQIPDSADVVLPIASVHAVGAALDEETVHRPERVAALTGLSLGDPIRAEDVAEVLASPEGGLKGVPPSATPIPVLNMVDDESHEATAREVAAEVHARADVPRVVLTRMVADDPLVDVVEA